MKRLLLTVATIGMLGVNMALVVPGVMAQGGGPGGGSVKWTQMPELSLNGVDVMATWVNNPAPPPSYLAPFNTIAADDFLCTQTGPVVGIRVWGSWLNDLADPTVTFHVSIHADVPVGVGSNPFSQPGAELWGLTLAPTQQRLYATSQERFYDAVSQMIMGTDTQVWQYNFIIPQNQAFQQTQGTIYWLEIQAQTVDANHVFGWKTRDPDPNHFGGGHYNDDATYGLNTTFGGSLVTWQPLQYPQTTNSADLAFVIETPEPSPWVLTALGGLLLLSLRWRGVRSS
jgi:hypothetical protein